MLKCQFWIEFKPHISEKLTGEIYIVFFLCFIYEYSSHAKYRIETNLNQFSAVIQETGLGEVKIRQP